MVHPCPTSESTDWESLDIVKCCLVKHYLRESRIGPKRPALPTEMSRWKIELDLRDSGWSPRCSWRSYLSLHHFYGAKPQQGKNRERGPGLQGCTQGGCGMPDVRVGRQRIALRIISPAINAAPPNFHCTPARVDGTPPSSIRPRQGVSTVEGSRLCNRANVEKATSYLYSSFALLTFLWVQKKKNAFFTTGEVLGAMEWCAKVQLS